MFATTFYRPTFYLTYILQVKQKIILVKHIALLAPTCHKCVGKSAEAQLLCDRSHRRERV